MRSLIIALMLIILITVCCSFVTLKNGADIQSVIKDLEALTVDDNIAPLQNRWDKLKTLLEYTAVRRDIQEIDDNFLRTAAACRYRDKYEFDTAKSTLIYLMKELRLNQGFSVKRLM